jgi:membrane protein implicated in regulation of membrane protease activity
VTCPDLSPLWGYFAVPSPVWFWLCLAGLLLILELATGSAFFLCLSTGALLTAGMGLVQPEPSLAQASLLFALLLIPASCCWWFLLRPRRNAARENRLNARDRNLIGTTAILTENSSGLAGRLRVADASWPYVCDRPLKKGEKVVVREARGLILYVVPCGEEKE